MEVLERLERYYDAVPRSDAVVEVHGALTLFVGTGAWPYYARPTLGVNGVDADDVRAMCRRMHELDIPQSFEWVHETTPSMGRAVTDAGLRGTEGPLLVAADPIAVMLPAGVRLLVVGAEDPQVGAYQEVARVAFHDPTAGLWAEDAAEGTELEHVRGRIADGRTVMMVAVDGEGPMAVGSHQPVQVAGEWISEIVGVATLREYRGRGLGAGIASALVEHALSFCELVFLSAGDDDAARVYERVGFARAGTACIAS